MARVTVEDCVDKVPNRFDLVLLAAQRAREISGGAELTLDRDRDKNPVVALREIAEQTIKPKELHEAAVTNLQKILPDDDDEMDEVGSLSQSAEALRITASAPTRCAWSRGARRATATCAGSTCAWSSRARCARATRSRCSRPFSAPGSRRRSAIAVGSARYGCWRSGTGPATVGTLTEDGMRLGPALDAALVARGIGKALFQPSLTTLLTDGRKRDPRLKVLWEQIVNMSYPIPCQ